MRIAYRKYLARLSNDRHGNLTPYLFSNELAGIRQLWLTRLDGLGRYFHSSLLAAGVLARPFRFKGQLVTIPWVVWRTYADHPWNLPIYPASHVCESTAREHCANTPSSKLDRRSNQSHHVYPFLSSSQQGRRKDDARKVRRPLSKLQNCYRWHSAETIAGRNC